MVDTAEKNKNYAMIFCDYFIVNIKGQVIDQFYRHETKKMKLKNQPAHGACSLINLEILKKSEDMMNNSIVRMVLIYGLH